MLKHKGQKLQKNYSIKYKRITEISKQKSFKHSDKYSNRGNSRSLFLKFEKTNKLYQY